MCPLINDIVPTISYNAVMTLGRLAGHDEHVAQLILKKDVLPWLIRNFRKQNVGKKSFYSFYTQIKKNFEYFQFNIINNNY